MDDEEPAQMHLSAIATRPPAIDRKLQRYEISIRGAPIPAPGQAFKAVVRGLTIAWQNQLFVHATDNDE